MNNIVRLFTDDIRRIGRNAVTIIIVLGLVILPSIFSWYNILACWNVFDNTGNLKVAVANVDEGYESSLVPVKVNIGERVVSALRANDQLEWVFTDEEDAIDGARSGRYYAAVVIPASFSSDMMSFYSSDVEHARITYYSNQKKSAIAPKMTDQGADRIANQVNRAFAEALSEIAIGISSTLIDQLNSSDLNSRIGDLCNHMDRLCTHMNDSAEVIALYSDILTSSQSLLSNSSALISQTKASADEVVGSAADAKETALTTADALSQASDALSEALQNSADSYQDVPAAIDNAFAAAGSLAADTASALRGDAATVNAQIEDLNSLVSKVTALRDFLPEGHRSTPDALIDKLNASIAVLQQLSASLEEAATKIETGSADAQAERDSIKQQAEQACAGLSNVKTEFESNVQPQLEELSNSLSDTSTAVSDTAALLDSTGSRMAGSASSLDQKIGSAKGKLDSATAELKQAAAEHKLDLAVYVRMVLSEATIDIELTPESLAAIRRETAAAKARRASGKGAKA